MDKVRKKYKSLTYESRTMLEQLLKLGYSKQTITDTLGVSYYTIYRELRVNNMTPLTYNAREAQRRKMKLRINRERNKDVKENK